MFLTSNLRKNGCQKKLDVPRAGGCRPTTPTTEKGLADADANADADADADALLASYPRDMNIDTLSSELTKNVMDETNNTPEVIDQNIGILDTYIEPVRGMEILVQRTTILKTGAISTGNFE